MVGRTNVSRNGVSVVSNLVNVTVHGAAIETVTLSDGQQVITDGNGVATARVTIGESYTLTGSVSGYTSKIQTVDENTTDLYAMPDGALFWYGVDLVPFTYKVYDTSYNSYGGTQMYAKSTHSYDFVQPSKTPAYIDLVTENSIDVSTYSVFKVKYSMTSALAGNSKTWGFNLYIDRNDTGGNNEGSTIHDRTAAVNVEHGVASHTLLYNDPCQIAVYSTFAWSAYNPVCNASLHALWLE